MTLFLAWLAAGLLPGFGSPVVAQPDTAQYAYTSVLPAIIDGQPVLALAFDPATHRLYAGNAVGLYWTDLSQARPQFSGPLFRGHIVRLEMAPDAGRLFYLSIEDIGYVDVRTDGPPRRLAKNDLQAIDLAYEPSRHELYVSIREPRLLVFDAQSGERGASIELPGWFGMELEAVPGRVFLQLADKQGLYSVEATTHRAAPWPVNGRIVTPAQIEADPTGRYLFLAYQYQVVAIDVVSATVTGRQAIFQNGIGFDPGTGLLLTLWLDPVIGAQRVTAFRADADQLTTVTTATELQLGGLAPYLEPTSHGFVVRGGNRLYVWSVRKTGDVPR